MTANLYSTFHEKFAPHAQRPFIVEPDGREYRFADLHERSGRFAACLVEQGVGRGDRVVVQVAKSFDAVALYMAALRTGAMYVPLNTAYTAGELQYFIADAEPSLVVCEPVRRAEVSGLARAAGVPRVSTLGAQGNGELAQQADTTEPQEAVARVSGDTVAAMLYTSGTTGRSKGAMLSADNLRSNALALHALWGFEPDDVLLHALPVYHVHGLFVALHCALLNASTVHFLPRFEVAAVRRAMRHCSVMMGVPTFYSRLLADARFGAGECQNMRLFVSGSAPLSPAVSDAFAQRTDHRVLERYGMTETGMIASNPLHGERLPGSVGFALPGVQLRITGNDGATLPADTAGEVEVRGPGVFAGYWRKPDKTKDSFRPDGWFRTGDLGSLDAGQRLWLKGRDSDLVISGGYNIYPAELEQAIDALPGVDESAIIGIPDQDLGEIVVAIIVGNPALAQSGELAAALQTSIARFKLPRRVYVVDCLPRNAMGKVQKNQLRADYTDKK